MKKNYNNKLMFSFLHVLLLLLLLSQFWHIVNSTRFAFLAFLHVTLITLSPAHSSVHAHTYTYTGMSTVVVVVARHVGLMYSDGNDTSCIRFCCFPFHAMLCYAMCYDSKLIKSSNNDNCTKCVQCKNYAMKRKKNVYKIQKSNYNKYLRERIKMF